MMRRSLLLVGPLAASLFAFACEDDPLNNPNPNVPEAGAFDANRPPIPDSGGPLADASPDGDAAQAQAVTVVVATRKGPRAGVTVVFHDATGAVLETKTTDATGRATSNAAGPIPAMATALLGKESGDREIFTWTAVEAGDELAVADHELYETLGSYSVVLPGLVTDAGGVAATSYIVNLGVCSGSGSSSPIGMNLDTQCTGATNAPLLAANDDTGTPLTYAFKKNVPPPADGGVVNVDGLTAWAAPSTFTVTVQNKPGVLGLNVSLLQIANGVATPNYTAFALDGADEAKFKVAPGYADAYQATATAPGTAIGANRRLGARVAGSMTATVFDFQQALPELESATVDAVDPLRPSLSWAANATLAGSDGGLVTTTYSYPDQGTVRWTLVVPPGATTGSVKAPALPAAAAVDFLPAADAGGSWGNTSAIFAEAEAVADYKAFRRLNGIIRAARGTGKGYLPANGAFKTTEIELVESL